MAEPTGNTPAEPTDRSLGAVLSWEGFELRLAVYLSTMVDPDEKDHLVLEVPGESGTEGCAPYVQFAAFSDGEMIRAEVVSNRYLSPAHRLSARQLSEFEGMGWEGGDEQDPNHYLERRVAEAKLLASMAVLVLRDHFHLPCPELLSIQVWGPAATGIAVLGLPDTADVPADIVDSARASRSLMVLYPEDRDQLLRHVRDALREEYDDEPTMDDDEDFLLVHLGQPVWVRVCKDEPKVQILARVVHNVHSRRQTAVELGLLNRDHPWPKWNLCERAVWQTLLIPGRPFAPEHLSDALEVFFAAMSTTRDDLAVRSGGSPG